MRVTAIACSLAVLACVEPAGRDIRAGGVQSPENTQPQWSPEDAWRLGEEPAIEIYYAEGTDSVLFFDPQSAFRDSRGQLVLADGLSSGQQAILVFDSAGRLLQRIGRRGQGPGEFSQLFWAKLYRADSIVAFDYGARSFKVFSPDGHHVRDIGMLTLLSPALGTVPISSYAAIGPFADGSLLAAGMGTLPLDSAPGMFFTRHSLLRVGPDPESGTMIGEVQRWLFRLDAPDPRQRSIVPLGPSGLLALGDSVFYEAISSGFLIRRYDLGGELTGIVRRPFTPRRVTDREINDYKTWTLQLMRSSLEANSDAVRREEERLARLNYPEVLPALSDMHVDTEGNLWVEHWRWIQGANHPNPTPATWSVFDGAGQWLGEITVPAGFRVSSITSDQVIGLWYDEFDAARLRVYALIKPLR